MTLGVSLTDFVSFGHHLADMARPVARQYFRKSLDVEIKSDSSPVTKADREIEALLRAEIAAVYPGHGMFGEEQGGNFDCAYTWVVDPIDGTKSFVTGVPMFGTLISLLYEQRPVLGIIDMPALGERWSGAGGQAWFGEEPARTSARGLQEARLFATSPDQFEGKDAEAFATMRRHVGLTRFGLDCYAYGLLASGHVDLIVEAGLQVYDVMALVPVVEGAGGVITDWQGAALSPGFDGRVVAAANSGLHAAALQLLQEG